MTEKELIKQYNEEWKKKQPVQYVVWLISSVGAWVPLLIAVFSLVIKGMNDNSVTTAAICLVFFAVIQIVAAVLMMQHKRGWKQYREDNKHKLVK